MNGLEDITPEGSVGPVYLDTTPLEPIIGSPLTPEQVEASRDQALAARVYPLVAKVALGLATQADIDAEYAAILAEYPDPE